ncbi:MAG: DUF853 family protein [Lachnospiraceae bacterium]|nr:DUF853 family protein [Lachnospiraceae bacterium]
MFLDQKVYIGKSGEEKIYILPQMSNRHGLIAGATGTGKTVSLKVMAESFSDCGVPVFLADVKRDLAGMCQSGALTEDMTARLDRFGLREDGFTFSSYPTVFWDVYGEKGLPLRTTISEMGPLLLGRILELNPTQMDVLTVVFRIADDEGLLLIDTKDLRSMLQYVSENAKEYSVKYGNIAKQSLGAIQRSLMALEAEGADQFFGETALNISDWLTTDANGRGTIQILDCQKLILNPTMYSTFLLWMLSELYETLPEMGDVEKPKMVFFFDEAHMLFDSASASLLSKIEQVVKLIRSKGVGIFFITQIPADVPDSILSQLGNKVQHALHAYTPAELRKVKAAAQSFRANPEFDTEAALQELGIGEALVSVLDENGTPSMVRRTNILPPQSQMGALDETIRQTMIGSSLLYGKYTQVIDRDSAYEFLERYALEQAEAAQRVEEEKQRLKEEAAAEKARQKEEEAAERARIREEAAAQKAKEREEAAAQKAREREEAAALKAKEKEEAAALKEAERLEKQRKNEIGKVAGSAAGTIGREIGNAVGKTVGGTFGKRLGGNIGAQLGRGILNTLFKK